MRDRLRIPLILTLLSALVALGAPRARAADDANHWTFSPYVGWTLMDSEFGSIALQQTGFEADDAINFGGRLGYVWAGGLGLELAGGYTPSKVSATTPQADADMTLMFGSLNLIYAPMPYSFGGPFLSGGFGFGRTSLASISPAGSVAFVSNEKDLDQGLLDLAAGWTFPLGGNLGLRAEVRNLLWVPEKKWDSSRLNYLLVGGALSYRFGGAKPVDTDGDGVVDKKDKCPNTPAGATVDATGCPSDADGDGVYDGIDQCASTPKGATVNARGCTSDTDGDGVLDGLDQCADTPKGATVDAKGCPMDADGDGVVDGLDQCANTPTGVKVDANGCPTDGDGDGVFDGLDKCENTPAGAKVDKDGCPIEITERETELLDTGMIRLQNINFETGKADLMQDSYATLDIVGQLLTRWPDLKIEIGGHTDARGTAKANQALSERRAQSVKDYIVGKFPGLNAEQYSVRGYGEDKPIAPNNNQVNMAKNRRVEFTVLNKDVLKKESERRKMLQK